MKNQHQYEKDLFLTGNVASATECTGRNATQPVNSEMEESFEDIYKTPPKPKNRPCRGFAFLRTPLTAAAQALSAAAYLVRAAHARFSRYTCSSRAPPNSENATLAIRVSFKISFALSSAPRFSLLT